MRKKKKLKYDEKKLKSNLDIVPMTQDEVAKSIQRASRKIPTKVVRTQADIDDFYED